MTYATMGFGAIDLPPNMYAAFNAAAGTAHDKARSELIQQGVPADVFDTVESLARGGLDLGPGRGGSVSDLLKSKALDLARRYGAPELDKATGLPPGTVNGILNAAEEIASGDREGAINDISTVVGAAAGTAICGPVCGLAGSVIGAVVGKAINAVIDGIGSLFGSDNEDRKNAELQRQQRAEIVKIQDAMRRRANEIELGVLYGVCRIYNKMLNLGIADPDAGAVIHQALACPKYCGDRVAYQNQHDGLQPEQVELVQQREAFFHAVQNAVYQAVPNNIFYRGSVESGWTDIVHRWSSALPDPRLLRTTNERVYCTWAEIGMPDCDAARVAIDGLGGFGFSVPIPGYQASGTIGGTTPIMSTMQQLNIKLCESPGMKLRLYQCHADDRHFLKWFADTALWFGQEWAAIATRDCALINLQNSVRKAKIDAANAGAQAIALAKMKGLSAPAAETAKNQAIQIALQKQAAEWAKIRNAVRGPKKFTSRQKAIMIGGVGLLAATGVVFLLPD